MIWDAEGAVKARLGNATRMPSWVNAHSLSSRLPVWSRSPAIRCRSLPFGFVCLRRDAMAQVAY